MNPTGTEIEAKTGNIETGIETGTTGGTVTRTEAGAETVSGSGTEMPGESGRETETRTRARGEIKTGRSTYAFDVRALRMKNIAGRRGLLLRLIMEMEIEVGRMARVAKGGHRGDNRRICIRRGGVVVVPLKGDMDTGAAAAAADTEVEVMVVEEASISRGT